MIMRGIPARVHRGRTFPTGFATGWPALCYAGVRQWPRTVDGYDGHRVSRGRHASNTTLKIHHADREVDA